VATPVGGAGAPPPSRRSPEGLRGRWIFLAVVSVIVIGVIALVVRLAGDRSGEPNRLTPTVSASVARTTQTASPTAEPTYTMSAEPTPSAEPQSASPEAPETSAPPQPAPPANPHQAYCDVFNGLGGSVANGADGAALPDASLPWSDNLAQLQEATVSLLSPLVANLDQLMAAGPPADVEAALAEVRNDFAELLAIFQRNPSPTMADAAAAYVWSKQEKAGLPREDYLEQQMSWVDNRSSELCP
jgi:hypothetical protein